MDLDIILNNKLPVERFHSFLIRAFLKQEKKKYKYPLKDPIFYKALIRGFKRYPYTVKLLLDNVDSYGTFNDYCMVYKFNQGTGKSNDFEEFLIKLIVKKLKDDEENLKKKRRTTLLAKWLPNQDKNLETKYKMVTKICKEMYPDDSDINRAKRKYRKLIVALRRNNAQPQEFLPKKEYEKMTALGLDKGFVDKHISKIVACDKLKRNLVTKYYLEFVSKSIFEMAILYTKKKFNEIEREAFERLWTERKNDYVKDMYKYHLNKETDLVVLDIGPGTTNAKKKFIVMLHGYLFKELGYEVKINKQTGLVDYNVDYNNSICSLLDDCSYELSTTDDLYDKYETDKRIIYVTGNLRYTNHTDKIKTLHLLFNKEDYSYGWNHNLRFDPPGNIYLTNFKRILNQSPDLRIQSDQRKEQRLYFTSSLMLGTVTLGLIGYSLTYIGNMIPVIP